MHGQAAGFACDQPSESVWRAAATIISATKSGTQTMHAFTLTVLLDDRITRPPAARRSQGRITITT